MSLAWRPWTTSLMRFLVCLLPCVLSACAVTWRESSSPHLLFLGGWSLGRLVVNSTRVCPLARALIPSPLLLHTLWTEHVRIEDARVLNLPESMSEMEVEAFFRKMSHKSISASQVPVSLSSVCLPVSVVVSLVSVSLLLCLYLYFSPCVCVCRVSLLPSVPFLLCL